MTKSQKVYFIILYSVINHKYPNHQILGIDGATGIGVHQLLSPAEIAEESSEHLGIMAYAARFLRLTPGVISYEHSYRDTQVYNRHLYLLD